MIKIHDAVLDKPKKSGHYMAMFLHDWTDHKGEVHTYVNVMTVNYDASADGWNVAAWDACRSSEMFPHAWAEAPTVEDVRNALKGEKDV